MLKELLSAHVDLFIDQGDTYYKEFTLRDNFGVPLNLTEYTAFGIVRRYFNTKELPGAPLKIQYINPGAGVIAVKMDSADSSSLKHDRYVYTINLVDESDNLKQVMSGFIIVAAH